MSREKVEYTLLEFAQDSIKMFLEYRDKHGLSEDDAITKAAIEMTDPGVQIIIKDAVPDLCNEKDAEIARLKALIADIRDAWEKYNRKWEEVNGKVS